MTTLRFMAVAAAVTAFSAPVFAQLASTPGVLVKPAQTMQRLSGVWVEGPGFDIGYGGTYDACAAKCLATAKCGMIEYYRPEKKCNMYDGVRPTLKGGSSDVALKK